MESRRCLRCNRILVKLPTQKRLNPKRRFCNRQCQTRDTAYKRYLRIKDDPEYKRKAAEKMKIWYAKPENKIKQAKSIKKDYTIHKDEWNERHFVGQHRAEFLKLINQKCECGEPVKVIHHETYAFKRPSKTTSVENVRFMLKEYSQFLIGFCSKKCHRNYEVKHPKSFKEIS